MYSRMTERKITMIKSVNLKPFDKFCEFPAYVYRNDVTKYLLVATVKGNYNITLAKLTTGVSVVNGDELSHVLFESYNDHGEKMSEVKVRVGGCEREFMAVKNALSKAGIELEPMVPCHFSEILNALGAFYKAANPEIVDYSVVSQRCH